MTRFSTLRAIWCLTLALSPALQAGNKGASSVDPTEKLRGIVSMLRILWGEDFDSNYGRYMLGPSPTVTLIPREEMIKIAAAELDGRRRDGKTTNGLTMGEEPNVKIVVVYDDIAPLFVARSINHEIGHLQLRDQGFSRNREEAHVRKIVDTGFFEKVFGREWFETTVAALKKKVLTVEKNGRLYEGYMPEAVEVFYQHVRNAGVRIERTPLHDGIVANLVFIFTNSEENLQAALDADDGVN